jgi:hypothetical protein
MSPALQETIAVPEAEAGQMQALNRFLHRGHAALISSAGEKVEFPDILYAVLTRIVEMMSRGQAITVVPYAPTKIREKKDIQEHAEDPPPFILREGHLYTFTDLRTSTAFGSAVKASGTVSFDDFSDWFSDEEYKRRAIELLNVCLRGHAWKRWLRFDGVKGRYFFSPKDGKPKRVSWRIGGRTRWREVTTPHTRREKLEDGSFKEIPFGWRHQGFRASFMLAICLASPALCELCTTR